MAIEKLTPRLARTMFLIFGALLSAASLPLPAEAQMGGFGRKGMGGGTEAPADTVEKRDHAITATGFTADFPSGFECEPVASPFGSPYRYDGSKRRDDRNSGLHGGMDLSLKEGTPLLAVAAGEVIARGEGGRLEGIFLWLRHAPADTGLPYWVFSKYQHLATLPEFTEGARVQVGQIIALSGATGTAGGHYGTAGYPHLHLSTFYGPSEEYTVKGMHNSMVQGKGAVPDDPLILYLREVNDLALARDFSAENKKIGVAVVGEDGNVHPAGSKTVWPVRCKQN